MSTDLTLRAALVTAAAVLLLACGTTDEPESTTTTGDDLGAQTAGEPDEGPTGGEPDDGTTTDPPDEGEPDDSTTTDQPDDGKPDEGTTGEDTGPDVEPTPFAPTICLASGAECTGVETADFGAVAVGNAAKLTLRIVNSGQQSGTLTAANADNELLSVGPVGGGDFPLEIAGGAELLLAVDLTAGAAPGPFAATLVLSLGGEDAPVALVALIGDCAPGSDSCDGSWANGCEVVLTNDIDHCGGCDQVCPATHGAPSCAAGNCQLACDEGFMQLALNEDFSASDQAAWAVSGPDGPTHQWSVVEQQFVQLEQLGESYVVRGSPELLDTVTSSVVVAGETGWVGVMARISANGHYLLRVSPADEKAELIRVESGQATILWASDSIGIDDAAAPATLQLSVVGGTLAATLDGLELVTIGDDAPLPAGQYGLYVSAGAAAFSQVTVSMVGACVGYCGDGACNVGVCEPGLTEASCSCPSGWTGAACELDIDECLEVQCAENAVCENLPGEWACSCLYGFDGDDCLDIDECAAETPVCGAEQTCVNEPGGFACGCSDGYESTLFADLFDGLDEGWEAIGDGEWTTLDGTATWSGSGSGQLLAGSETGSEYRVGARLSPAELGSVGLVLRATEAGYYAVTLAPPLLTLSRFDGNVETVLAEMAR